MIHDDALVKEVSAHLQMCVSKCVKIVPRSDILDHISEYVGGDSAYPYIVYGQSGCGKTSIMALTALRVGVYL